MVLEVLLSRLLIHKAGKLVQAVGRRSEFFATGTLHWTCLSVLLTWWLISARESEPRKSKVEAAPSFMILALEVTHQFLSILLVVQVITTYL